MHNVNDDIEEETLHLVITIFNKEPTSDLQKKKDVAVGTNQFNQDA